MLFFSSSRAWPCRLVIAVGMFIVGFFVCWDTRHRRDELRADLKLMGNRSGVLDKGGIAQERGGLEPDDEDDEFDEDSFNGGL